MLPAIFRDGCRDPEEGVGEPECVGCHDDCESCETYENANSVKPLTEPEEVAPGAQWDVVAIYDNAGIPSIMHRFRRMNDKDLFRGGKDKPHPAFIIGGEVYDEIYISVYQNTMINGKPYSLPTWSLSPTLPRTSLRMPASPRARLALHDRGGVGLAGLP